MRKNIWYITKYFSPKTKSSPGGRAWFLLKEIQERYSDVVIITSDSNALIEPLDIEHRSKVEIVDGVKLVWLKTYKYKVAKSIKRIISWFHFEIKLLFMDKRILDKPDTIVVSSLSLLTILNGLILKKKYNCRLVFEVRDIWPLTLTEEGGVSQKNIFVKFLAWLERLGYKKSDAIVGTMPNLKEHVKSVVDCETPVYCIPMGVSDDHLNTLDVGGEYRDKYLSSNKFKVVHAGTIGITNALDVFFECAKLLECNRSIEFIVVGDGPLKQHYIDMYSNLSNVIFAPKVGRNQVQSVLSSCDLVYFSTFKSKVWCYGQSLNKVVDYMLSGKPILASYSGFPSMINEAKCGYFVPAERVEPLVEKIIHLSELPKEELLEMGHRGKDWLMENRNYRKLSQDLAEVL